MRLEKTSERFLNYNCLYSCRAGCVGVILKWKMYCEEQHTLANVRKKH